MKRKNTILFLVLIAMVSFGSTFAYWYSGIEGLQDVSENNTIVIGTAHQATASVVVDTQSAGGILVPYGQSVNADESAVEYVLFIYEVAFTEEANFDPTWELTVLIENVEINNDATHASLLNVSWQIGGTQPSGLDGESVLENTISYQLTEDDTIFVYVLVTLTAPQDDEQYDAIKGGSVTFDVVFNVDELI